MFDFQFISAVLAVCFSIPAAIAVQFGLRTRRSRWVFVFMYGLLFLVVGRLAFWDFLPKIVHLEQWGNFAEVFHGASVNTFLNFSVTAASLYALKHKRQMVRPEDRGVFRWIWAR